MNRLQRLHDAGQSLWLDFIERTMIHDGDLARRIREDALTGMTSNPTIFEKALAEGSAYDEQVRRDAEGRDALALFEAIEATDVRDACDQFRGVYDATNGGDGYVSIEVSPGVAHHAEDTVEEAQRLWQAVDRPNVMIKVPGTEEGAKAVRALIAQGINVNITLLFSIDAYARVVEAYLAGLEDRVKAGGDVSRIASVASFFVSRVDTEVDQRLDKLAEGASDAAALQALRGKAAIANAKMAYQLFLERFSGARWEALATKGARLQRPLWASTSTKNKAYRDVIYVEQLIGPNTVNTLPPATLEAFRDHGEVEETVTRDVEGAKADLDALARIGVDMKDVTDKLLRDGLTSFQKSFDTLLSGLEAKTRALGAALAGR
jgi:transaldolase